MEEKLPNYQAMRELYARTRNQIVTVELLREMAVTAGVTDQAKLAQLQLMAIEPDWFKEIRKQYEIAVNYGP